MLLFSRSQCPDLVFAFSFIPTVCRYEMCSHFKTAQQSAMVTAVSASSNPLTCVLTRGRRSKSSFIWLNKVFGYSAELKMVIHP